MHIGVIGLGRMGGNMAGRLLDAGHSVVAHDVRPDAAAQLVERGAGHATTLADLVGALPPRRAVWIMVPAAGDHAGIDPASPLA